MAKTVLVVDDDPTQRRLLQAVLERDGHAVVHAASGGEAIDRMTRGGGADVILLDMIMPEMSGLECLAELRSAGVTTPVIVLTANGGIDTVVKAMQAGAQDFFVKPVGPERLLVGVRNALKLEQLTTEVGRLTKRVQGRASFDDIIGDSAPMRMVKALGARAAKSSIPVLITGESGVGKEVIARALHGAGDRAGKPFVAVNCGALPDGLIESELFGHELGAFAGAMRRRVGHVERAHNGSLFLDEVESMPLAVQVKMLRVLEEREIHPIGANEPRVLDLRILASAKIDLGDAARRGVFREDLFYRLNVVRLRVPPLRERREDIPLLFAHFLRRAADRQGLDAPEVDDGVRRRLLEEAWPGNIRELAHFAERVVLGLEDGRAEATSDLSLPDRLHRFEGELLRDALETHRGDIVAVLEEMRIPRKTLYDKLQRHGLKPADFRR